MCRIKRSTDPAILTRLSSLDQLPRIHQACLHSAVSTTYPGSYQRNLQASKAQGPPICFRKSQLHGQRGLLYTCKTQNTRAQECSSSLTNGCHCGLAQKDRTIHCQSHLSFQNENSEQQITTTTYLYVRTKSPQIHLQSHSKRVGQKTVNPLQCSMLKSTG